MNKMKLIIAVLSILTINFSNGQTISILKDKIEKILIDKNATVGVAIAGISPDDTISINGDKQLPMQSVYKYHLALTVLREVDKRVWNLNDTIEITKEHLDNSLWSMIRKKIPDGGILKLSEVIKYTVANSDNVGCDLLFDMIGGPIIAQNYMHETGISQVAIRDKEAMLQSDWKMQYRNWTTANAANKTLKLFFENKENQLSAKSHKFLWEIMKKSWFGKISMKTYLPEDVIIAHKTGHSGKNDEGITGAQNDIGIIFLPNGNYFYLSILISDSTEESKVNKKIIADIAKLSYDYFKDKNE